MGSRNWNYMEDGRVIAMWDPLKVMSCAVIGWFWLWLSGGSVAKAGWLESWSLSLGFPSCLLFEPTFLGFKARLYHTPSTPTTVNWPEAYSVALSIRFTVWIDNGGQGRVSLLQEINSVLWWKVRAATRWWQSWVYLTTMCSYLSFFTDEGSRDNWPTLCLLS